MECELQLVSQESLKGKTANKEEGARLDVAANGICGGRFEMTFVNVQIFNPHAPTNANQLIPHATSITRRQKKKSL